MNILNIFTVSELYDNIVNRLSIYDKINLYDVSTFIKNKDERIFVKNIGIYYYVIHIFQI